MYDARVETVVTGDPVSARAIEMATSGFMAWSETFATPTAFVAANGTHIWSNRAAKDLWSSASHFRLSNSRLVCVDQAQEPAFRSYLTNVTETPAVWVCRGDPNPLLVRAERVSLPEGGDIIGLVVLSTNPPASDYLWGDFGGLFGLTPSEVEVIKLLIAGQKAEEAAALLGVSVETVRTHIKRAYVKLGINSREQLFAVISAFRTT